MLKFFLPKFFEIYNTVEPGFQLWLLFAVDLLHFFHHLFDCNLLAGFCMSFYFIDLRNKQSIAVEAQSLILSALRNRVEEDWSTCCFGYVSFLIEIIEIDHWNWIFIIHESEDNNLTLATVINDSWNWMFKWSYTFVVVSLSNMLVQFRVFFDRNLCW